MLGLLVGQREESQNGGNNDVDFMKAILDTGNGQTRDISRFLAVNCGVSNLQICKLI